MREFPEMATFLGDYRYNDRWSDLSLAHVRQQRADLKRWIERFEALDTTGFTEQERLNQTLMLRNLKMRLEGIDLKTFEMPIDQVSGVHLRTAQIVNLMPFNTTEDYENYLSRLRQVPVLIDEIIEVLQQGKKDQLLRPRYLLEKAAEQCKSIAEPAGKDSLFAHPLAHFSDLVTATDRTRLNDSIVMTINRDVRPAYSKLANFLMTEYAPQRSERVRYLGHAKRASALQLLHSTGDHD